MTDVYLSNLQVAKRYGVHRSTPWRWLHSGIGFPHPIKLGCQATRWKLSDLEAWEAARGVSH